MNRADAYQTATWILGAIIVGAVLLGLIWAAERTTYTEYEVDGRRCAIQDNPYSEDLMLCEVDE